IFFIIVFMGGATASAQVQEKPDQRNLAPSNGESKDKTDAKAIEPNGGTQEENKREEGDQSGRIRQEVPLGFDKYPKREYPLLFNNVLYNLLYRPSPVSKLFTVPAGTIPSALTLESGYSMIERLSNYPVNLLYDKIGTGWTSLILLTKMTFLDFPFAYFMMVFNHEYSGHTMRLHEAGQSINRITIGVPLPWGSGGGATAGTIPMSVDENIFIKSAGSEANMVLAHEMDL